MRRVRARAAADRIGTVAIVATARSTGVRSPEASASASGRRRLRSPIPRLVLVRPVHGVAGLTAVASIEWPCNAEHREGLRRLSSRCRRSTSSDGVVAELDCAATRGRRICTGRSSCGSSAERASAGRSSPPRSPASSSRRIPTMSRRPCCSNGSGPSGRRPPRPSAPGRRRHRERHQGDRRQAVELLQHPAGRRAVVRRLRGAAHLPAVPEDGRRAAPARPRPDRARGLRLAVAARPEGRGAGGALHRHPQRPRPGRGHARASSSARRRTASRTRPSSSG